MKISIIIPTIHRSKELDRLLTSFVAQTQLPHEIIIIEQGDKNTIPTLKNQFPQLPIRGYHVNFRSLTKARNLGVDKAQGDIIGFLDDDIVLHVDYIERIHAFFASHEEARGVQGLITNFEEGHAKKVGGKRFMYTLYNIFAKIFLLNNSSNQNKLLWSGRNQYASRVTHITQCEWLSGIGNYRRTVFEDFHFDETLEGYALGEDKLFSYPIFEAYPESLFLDPSIQCEHHHADSGRPQDKAWVDMKISYTHYLWYQLFKKKGLRAYVSYVWANIGDVLVVFLSVLFRQHRFIFWWWHVQHYWNLIWTTSHTTH